ncbi:hypothetical protein P7K49_016562 [Saguinus oedipus]|uniref:Uncharacterized protein n=1 Tax=Saguinus oedipus TaxID=9490 RepID=A0ABQ9VEE9_SAGOE|nr:hypothetical protein P7K49_016562 [Saguinus oedipus]
MGPCWEGARPAFPPQLTNPGSSAKLPSPSEKSEIRPDCAAPRLRVDGPPWGAEGARAADAPLWVLSPAPGRHRSEPWLPSPAETSSGISSPAFLPARALTGDQAGASCSPRVPDERGPGYDPFRDPPSTAPSTSAGAARAAALEPKVGLELRAQGSGSERRPLTGSRALRLLAPGTSASLLARARPMGARGRRAASVAGARASRGAARGAAAVAVTSREGVGAARELPDYKRTLPAAAGVARPGVSAASSACACSFSSSSSSSSSSGCRGGCGRKVRKLGYGAAVWRAAATSGAAGELRGRAAFRASRSLHLPRPPPLPLPPGARLWADPSSGGSGSGGGGSGVASRRLRLRLGPPRCHRRATCAVVPGAHDRGF